LEYVPAEKNVVYNNYERDSANLHKKIFEKTYLVKDSLRKFEWKISEEFRKIAGFNCRRAETIIMDSVYVIAFYTDAIIAEGGPEGFNGLPGMILRRGNAPSQYHLFCYQGG
jgi:GLPGLI family protein